MRSSTTSNQEIMPLITGLLNELCRLRREFFVMEALFSDTMRADLLFQKAPLVYNTIQRSLIDSMIVSVGRIMDDDRNSITAHRLLSLLPNNPQTRADVESAQAFFDRLRSKYLELKPLRNKHIAHKDYKHNAHAPGVKYKGASHDDIQEIVDGFDIFLKHCQKVIGFTIDLDEPMREKYIAEVQRLIS